MLARGYVRKYSPYVIGITGSVGKTSCRMVVTEVLRAFLPQLTISTSPKNYNSDIGVALAILEIESHTPSWRWGVQLLFQVVQRRFGGQRYDILVLEYGIDQPDEIDTEISMVAPDSAIFTTLDKVHAHQLGGPDEILAEKMKLFFAAKDIVFYPIDGTYLWPYLSMIEVDSLSYSMHEDIAHEADMGFVDYQLLREGDTVRASFALDQGKDRVMQVTTNVLGKEHAAYIVLGVELAMILAMRFELDDLFTEHLSLEATMQPGRYQLLEWVERSLIVDSTYNAAPASMRKMINNTIQLRNQLFSDRALIYCLGDMRELGEFAEQEHKQLASLIAQSADRVYLLGDSMQSRMVDELVKVGFNQQKIYLFDDSVSLGKQLKSDLLELDQQAVILCKWSQNTIFLEEAVKQLLADPTDADKLCRQSWRRQRKKAALVSQYESDA